MTRAIGGAGRFASLVALGAMVGCAGSHTVDTAGHGQLSPRGRAAGEHDRVGSGPQLLDVEVRPDLHAGPKDRAFGTQLLQTPVESALLHLELGDAVAKQATDTVGPFVRRRGRPGSAAGQRPARPDPSRPQRPSCPS